MEVGIKEEDPQHRVTPKVRGWVELSLGACWGGALARDMLRWSTRGMLGRSTH